MDLTINLQTPYSREQAIRYALQLSALSNMYHGMSESLPSEADNQLHGVEAVAAAPQPATTAAVEPGNNIPTPTVVRIDPTDTVAQIEAKMKAYEGDDVALDELLAQRTPTQKGACTKAWNKRAAEAAAAAVEATDALPTEDAEQTAGGLDFDEINHARFDDEVDTGHVPGGTDSNGGAVVVEGDIIPATDLAEVRAAVGALMNAKGGPAARAMLAGYGVDKVSAINPDLYAEVVTAAAALMAS